MDALLASAETTEQLASLVILFVAALLGAWAMRALHAPTILGFLVAGILIGPYGLGVMSHDTSSADIEFMAELGLVLLLFTVGLELSPEPLLRAGWRLIGIAGIQLGVTTALTAVLLTAVFGAMGWSASLLVGVAVALSSTAIVLKHLSDQGETDTPSGALITGVLLLQDVVVLVLLILLPLSVGGDGSLVGMILKVGGALVGLVIAVGLARFVLPVVMAALFRFGGLELMTLFAIVMASGGAWLAGIANWSLPLGAFLAGLLLASSDVSHQLRAEITPFRNAFNALFFVSIGMLAPLDLVVAEWQMILIWVVGVLAIKAIIVVVSGWATGWALRLSVTAGLGLAAVSEFSYVLLKEARDLGLVEAHIVEQFIAVLVGTMLIGAVLVPFAGSAGIKVARWIPTRKRKAILDDGLVPASPSAGHVIIVGYGINGQNLATVLSATRIPHVVIEMDRAAARRARTDQRAIVVGDALRLSILSEAKLSTARALVVTIADAAASRSIVAQVHRARPELYILARTRHVRELENLCNLGANTVIPEEFETSIELFAHLLREFAIPDNVVEQQINLVRAGQYGMLRGRPAERVARQEWIRILESTVTRTLYVSEGSIACGKPIRDIDLRAQTGVTIVAVTRMGKATPSPSPDYVIEAGDVLVVVGTHAQLDAARLAIAVDESEASAQKAEADAGT